MNSAKANPPKTRKLKVYPKHRVGNKHFKVVPEIRLCGQWLRDVGFKSGNFIEVISEMNKITITMAEKG
jgi:toxic protein SymE